MMPFLITQEVKLQMFQLKIIHNMLPTRRSLFRARLSESDSCRAYQTEPETLPHMLFQCNIISAFWIAFQQRWYETTHRTFEVNECNVIHGWYDTQLKDVLNYVTLVAKYLIFCCFQDNTAVTFDRFPGPFLSTKIDILRQIALKNRQIEELKTVEESHLTRFPFNLVSFVCFRRYIYISFILSFSFLTDTMQVQSFISHVIVTHFCILTLHSTIILLCCMYKCENSQFRRS